MNKLVKILICIAIVIVVAVGFVYLLEYYVFVDRKAQNYYSQATEFAQTKDYQNAFYNYLKVKPTSKYYPIALYRQAWCANMLEDKTTAADKYKSFITKYPNSIFTPRAKYEYARNLYMLQKYDESAAEFKDIKQQDLGSNYAIAANYFLGMIEKVQAKKSLSPQKETLSDILDNDNDLYGNYDKVKLNNALAYWIEYISACPHCRYTQSSIDEVLAVAQNLEQEAYSKIGKAFYMNEKYQPAIEYLQKGIAIKYWGFLVQALAKDGDKESAKQVFEQNYVKNGRTLNRNDLNDAINTYVQLFDDKKGVWQTLLQAASDNQLDGQDFILYNLALVSSGEEKTAFAQKVVQQYPTSLYAPEMMWILFRNNIKAKDFNKAAEIGERYLTLYKNSKLEPAFLFWMGKIHHTQKEYDKAKFYYSKLLTNYADDYYAYRAAEMSHIKNTNWHENSRKKLDTELENTVTIPFEYTDWSDIDKSWVELAVEAKDLDILDELLIDNKIIQSWICYKNADFSTAAVYARDWLAEQSPKPDFDKSPYKLAFPYLYSEEIAKNAKKLNLDEYLILALIKEESYFNKLALSATGAKGLMQVMPSTASFIAAERDIPYATSDQLSNPNFNILIGCNYFDYIKKQLHNSNLLAVAAYNGGPGAVSSWLKNKEYMDFDDFVEDITYPETRNYVKKIYKAYWNYLNIYK